MNRLDFLGAVLALEEVPCRRPVHVAEEKVALGAVERGPVAVARLAVNEAWEKNAFGKQPLGGPDVTTPNDISAKAVKVLAQKVAFLRQQQGCRTPGTARDGVDQSHCRTLVLAGRDLDQHVGRVVQVHLKDARRGIAKQAKLEP